MNWRERGLQFKAAVAVVFLIACSACSNPLSGKNGAAQNFHSKNMSCEQLSFSQENVTPLQVRSLIHCLNAAHEIEAVENLILNLTDADLEPFAALLNQAVNKQPKSLYLLREAYLQAEKNGKLEILEKSLADLLSRPEMNLALSKVLQKNSGALADYLFNSEIDTHLGGIYAVLKSEAYQRFGAETIEGTALKTLIEATSEYLRSPDATHLPALYQLMSKNGLETGWSALTANDEQEHLQKLAHFFEWLFTDGHYSLLSDNLHGITSTPVRCFNGQREIQNPLTPVLNSLSKLDAEHASLYFKHDIKNLFLVAQGYCEFPAGVSSMIQLIEEASQVDGFAETFTLIRPLLQDFGFVRFVASRASAAFVKNVSFIANQHFFEDFFTLVSINTKAPLSSNGEVLSELLDQIAITATPEDTQVILNFLKPAVSHDKNYGLRFVQTLYQATFGFPSLPFPIAKTLQAKLRSSSVVLLSQSNIPQTFDLAASLIQSKKINAIITQTFGYFSALFARGKFAFKIKSFTEPEVSGEPVSFWLIERLAVVPTVKNLACRELSEDWNFANYTPSNSDFYQKQMEAIATCLDSNQTFKSARDLVEYSIQKANYPVVLAVQRAVFTAAFTLDSENALHTLTDFLAVDADDSNTLREYFGLVSQAIAFTKDAFLSKPLLRKFVGDTLKDPLSYQALNDVTGAPPPRSRSSAPTLDLAGLTHVNAIVAKNKTLKNAKIEVALGAMFEEFCPSFNTDYRDCDLDQDQISLYLKSPLLLYQQIVQEYLSSSQSWLHPLIANGLTHQASAPKQVSDLEYHLNPALHLFRGAPQAPRSLLKALKRISDDHMSAGQFLEERAVKFTLIPYIFQLPTYPASGNREYHHRVRIRLVSDIDRLELIAINADFKAFGLVANMGMGFIREIGLAWGDVPEAQRPSTLSLYKDSANVRTLKEVKEFIEGELARYDSGLLQRVGACDPRGRSAFHRLIFSPLCNNEIHDLSARVFNLRFLISLLNDELPEKDGGSGGLAFMRDLFFSLYDSNNANQRDNFANGVDLKDDCLQNPLQFTQPLSRCQKDLLTLIPRVTHLGLLHQAGLSILTAQDHPVNRLTHLMEHVSTSTALSEAFIKTISQDSGIKFVRDAVDFGFQAPEKTAKNLALISQTLSTLRDDQWINLALELVSKSPHALNDHRALLNALLSLDTATLVPWVDFWLAHPESSMVKFLSAESSHLAPELRVEALQFLTDVTPVSKDLSVVLETARKLPALDTPDLKTDLRLWAWDFSQETATQTRTELASWVNSPSFDQACGVLGDPDWVTKAYNFLESVNQNPDSKVFLQSCQDFLSIH